MVKFLPTPKQQIFIDAVFSGVYKFLFYGGAAGGGKTYVGLALLILLCKFFPGSKWHVLRKDSKKLEKNTIPIFNRLCPKSFLIKLVGGVAYMTNGSQIHFIGESYDRDKDLTWMDGLETNGFLLEEVQELQKKTFDKAKLRAGRNILPNMPPILILCTGNPSQNWSKEVFVKPHRENKLQAPYYFLPALMADNPHLPTDYVEGLSTLDSITYARYVLGDWDAIDVERPFAYGFRPVDKEEDGKRLYAHIGHLEKPIKTLPLYLSFDFNVDPITCIAAQHSAVNNNEWIRIHKEFRLENSNIYKLCAKIKEAFPGYYFYVTGDASGNARSAMVQDNLTYYIIIKKELGLRDEQMKVPSSNPVISNNRVLCNALLEKHKCYIISVECKYLIEDLIFVEVDENGDIDKNKDKRKTHLLDCFRYYNQTFHYKFVKHPL